MAEAAEAAAWVTERKGTVSGGGRHRARSGKRMVGVAEPSKN